MSCPEVTQKLTAAIRSGEIDVAICNIANPDMVGHTGNIAAAVQAAEAVDIAIGAVAQAVRETGGALLITADHGNLEMMRDPDNRPATYRAHGWSRAVRLSGVACGDAAQRRRAARRRSDHPRPARPAATGRDERVEPARSAPRRLMPGLRAPFAAALALTLAWAAIPAAAQNSREAERRLEKVQSELKEVAAERRRIEGERGQATRQLREADEQVGRSSRSLRSIEQRIASEQATLAQLQQRRNDMQARLGTQRDELARLLRAAYQQGEDAPLKTFLAQDQVAQGGRLLTYHRYLQTDRVQRIAALTSELEQLDAIEREIASRHDQLESTRAQQRQQLAKLESDRRARAGLVSKLDQRYQDRSSRERELGRDAQGLQQVLKRLRDTRHAPRRSERPRRPAPRASRPMPASRRRPSGLRHLSR
jgi:peptidoglycan hydrolase CwlO-like protein